MHTDYTGQGVDQLQNVIDTIKKDPNNRRIIMSAWNPSGTSHSNEKITSEENSTKFPKTITPYF